jgi:hypothetical protein
MGEDGLFSETSIKLEEQGTRAKEMLIEVAWFGSETLSILVS